MGCTRPAHTPVRPIAVPLVRCQRARMAHTDASGGEAGLQLCLMCGSHYMVPVESRGLGDGGCVLTLRCGECGVWRIAVAPPGAARAFARALEEDLASIRDAIERLDRERMAAEANAFIAALALGLVDAGDFRTPS